MLIMPELYDKSFALRGINIIMLTINLCVQEGRKHMRIYSTILSLILVFLCSSVSAVEPIIEQQLMLYYQIPLGGNNQHSSKHKFGLRLDQTLHSPRQVTEFSSVMKKPAMLDLQMQHKEPLAFKIHGVDYTERLYTHHADAAENAAADTQNIPEETGAEATAATEGEVAEEATEEKTIVQKTLDEMPTGVIIGVILGIAILAGVGG